MTGTAPGLVEFGRRSGSGECLIHKDKWDVREPLAELIGEGAHLRRRASLAAIHAQRQTDDQRVNAADFRKPGDPCKGITPAGINRLDGVRQDAEIIRRRNANAHSSMVNPERRMDGWK